MSKTTVDSVRELLHQLPQDAFTFDDLRKHVPTDYDTLKHIVFELLTEQAPCLRQVFDSEARAMRFQRVKP